MSVVTTKECPDCGFRFLRYVDYMPGVVTAGRQIQQICETCHKPVTPKIVRHPELKSLDELPA